MIIGALLLLLLLDYFCVLQFQIKILVGTPNSLVPKITTLAEELKTSKENIRKLPQYKKEVEVLSGKVEKINRKIKTREEVPAILESISRLASKNGVNVERLSPNTSMEEPVLKNENGQYFSVPIFMDANGGYHDFGRFLNQLETEEIFLSVTDFSIASRQADKSHHAIKMTLDAIIFEGIQ